MIPDIPGYSLFREIDKGGMGVVYRAQRDSDGADVAIKVLPPTLMTPTTAKRFRREGQALMEVDHPNVVRVFDVDCHQGVHFIAMEFLPGKSLSRLIRSNKKGAPIDLVLRYGLHVARALSVIHGRGMIHRDLKPGNVVILEDTGIAKLLDFGLVQVEGLSMLTATGSILGTPLYMSPEQCAARPLDLRSDVYSFGVLLFHLLTGKPPFESQSAYELLEMQQHTVPDAPSKIRRDTPTGLDQLILRCLEKNPQDRYGEMDTPLAEIERVANELGCCVDGDPAGDAISKAGPSRGPSLLNLRKRATNKRVVVGAAAALTLTGLVTFHPQMRGFRTQVSEALTRVDDELLEASDQDNTPSARQLHPEVTSPDERARLSGSHWNRGRELESQGRLAQAFEEYRVANLLYARTPYLRKLIGLAITLGRHEEVRGIVEHCLRQSPKLDPDGTLRHYLRGGP